MKFYAKVITVLLLTIMMVSCNDDHNFPTERPVNVKLVGNWIRLGQNNTWTAYSYRANSELYRATNADLNLRRFGSYETKADTMFFVNSPENYTPVIFEIKDEVRDGVRQNVLYLYDAKTRVPYGFYTRISNQELKDQYGVTIE